MYKRQIFEGILNLGFQGVVPDLKTNHIILNRQGFHAAVFLGKNTVRVRLFGQIITGYHFVDGDSVYGCLLYTSIGVRFKDVGKVYYFDPGEETLKKGDKVIVETARGIECGEVAMENREVAEESIVRPLRKMIRKANEADLKKVKQNEKLEKNAFEICLKKIADHKLDMKLVDVEYTFDNNKILFYFTADGRVDFRELVRCV